MQLAHPRFGYIQYRANFLEIQFIGVVQRHHQLFTFRQPLDGVDQCAAKSLIRRFAEWIERFGRRGGSDGQIVQAGEPTARGILHDGVVIIE